MRVGPRISGRLGSHLSRAALFLGVLASVLAVGHREAAAQADLQPPTIVSRSPGVGATGVSTQASVLVTFDEPIAPTSLTLSLRAGTTTIAAAISYNEATQTATLDPNADLAGNALPYGRCPCEGRGRQI